MLSQIQGASFTTLGTMNQTATAAVNSTSERDVFHGCPGQNTARADSGMNSPVFTNQNHRMFSSPWSQPNSRPKNVPALATLSWVDHQICGSARASAATT